LLPALAANSRRFASAGLPFPINVSFRHHRHGLVHAFNAPSDNLGFEPIVTSCHVAFPVARQGKNRTSGLAGVPPPLKRMPQVKGVRGAVICCKGNIRAEGG
jgi:hypothetical protein